jgi:hypothetical protein
MGQSLRQVRSYKIDRFFLLVVNMFILDEHP